MSSSLLVEHFGRIIEAPDGVLRLRRFVLDLAARGKLAEQDPSDEPASELVSRIQAERERLVEAGEIRQTAPYPSVDPDEAPFGVPSGWEWVRVRQVTSDRGQTIPDRDFTYIDVTAINKEVGYVSDAKIVSAIDAPSRARKVVRPGDVVYSCVRPYLLNIAVIDSEIVPAPIASTAFAVLNGFGLVLPKYLWIVLRCSFMIECVEAKMRGQAYPAINDSDFALLPLPLPPLAEQRRIVTKVDALMKLCHRLEAAQSEREGRRDQLVTASLDRINQAPDDECFREGVRFLITCLPRFSTRPDQLTSLRQAILNLAVRGRLVPQDVREGSGSELLDQILQEKRHLAAEGALKKDKEPWEGLPSGPAYELPPNWTWARLQDVFEISRGGSPRPAGDPRFFGGSIPWITVREITKDPAKVLTTTEAGLTAEGALRSRFIDPGDLLLTNSGATLGVPKISGIRACMNDGVAVLRAFHSVPLNDFAYLYLHSQTEAFRRVNQGMGQPNLNTGIIAGWFFPLPPLAEQRRIVAKVDELNALCNRLEEQLVRGRTEGGRLIDALQSALAVGA